MISRDCPASSLLFPPNPNYPAMYRIWYSTESFADYLIQNTALSGESVEKSLLCESDAAKPKSFHAMPDHIKKILYLDAPDIIIEKDNEPVLSIEESKEAGTGHNVFQRFARIAAAVENGVPAFYVYPEAAIIKRGGATRWDAINPAVFQALESTMGIYSIPAFLFYYPSDYAAFKDDVLHAPHRVSKGLIHDVAYPSCPDSSSTEMKGMFSLIDDMLAELRHKPIKEVQRGLLAKLAFRDRRCWMTREFAKKANGRDLDEMSPLSAVVRVPTSCLLAYMSKYEKGDYKVGALLRSRKETVIYQIDAKFRGDPYPGCLAAIDYMKCREGKTFEDRKYNLVLLFGKVGGTERALEVTGSNASVEDFIKKVFKSQGHNNLLKKKKYADLKAGEVPRYYMQVRYGSTYSKVKHIRVFSYFADAVIFPDGALWRDA